MSFLDLSCAQDIMWAKLAMLYLNLGFHSTGVCHADELMVLLITEVLCFSYAYNSLRDFILGAMNA